MKRPETPGELFDYLHEKFGIGDYDDQTAAKPYWKERGTQIAKLKAMMKRRRVDVETLVITADYAVRHKKPIHYYPQLFEQIAEAKREHRAMRHEQRRVDLHNKLWEAAREAWDAGEDEWGERLIRATGSDAERLLEEWGARG